MAMTVYIPYAAPAAKPSQAPFALESSRRWWTIQTSVSPRSRRTPRSSTDNLVGVTSMICATRSSPPRKVTRTASPGPTRPPSRSNPPVSCAAARAARARSAATPHTCCGLTIPPSFTGECANDGRGGPFAGERITVPTACAGRSPAARSPGVMLTTVTTCRTSARRTRPAVRSARRARARRCVSVGFRVCSGGTARRFLLSGARGPGAVLGARPPVPREHPVDPAR